MTQQTTWSWICALLMVGGCSSAPVHYYTLTPPHSMTTDASGAGLVRIDMPAARMPDQVNRSELVVRRGNDELVFLENDQWASSPGEEIRTAMLIALRADLAGADAARIRQFANISIVLDIQRFDSVPGRYDAVEATWRVVATVAADSAPRVIACAFTSQLPISRGNAAMVAGYQRQVAWLAEDVSAVLLATASDRQPDCPTTHNPGSVMR